MDDRDEEIRCLRKLVREMKRTITTLQENRRLLKKRVSQLLELIRLRATARSKN